MSQLEEAPTGQIQNNLKVNTHDQSIISDSNDNPVNKIKKAVLTVYSFYFPIPLTILDISTILRFANQRIKSSSSLLLQVLKSLLTNEEYLLTICVYFFREFLIHILCQYFNWFICVFLFDCQKLLYVMNIKPLSATYVAKFFSQSFA